MPVEAVPEPLRPLVIAGMAKDPSAGRPTRSLLTELGAVASGGYGQDWAERGRSHLGEAALLLAALSPAAHHPRSRERRAPDLPAPAFQRNQSSHRGRYRDRGRGGGHGSRCYRFAHRASVRSHPVAEVRLISLQPSAVLVLSVFILFILAVAVGVAVLASADVAITRARADAVIVV